MGAKGLIWDSEPHSPLFLAPGSWLPVQMKISIATFLEDQPHLGSNPGSTTYQQKRWARSAPISEAQLLHVRAGADSWQEDLPGTHSAWTGHTQVG